MHPTSRDRLITWVATGPLGRLIAFFLDWGAFLGGLVATRIARAVRR